MTRKENRAVKLIQSMKPSEQVKTIQAMGVEGIVFDVAMDSMYDGTAMFDRAGVANTFTSYTRQTQELYKKYNGESEYGNAQVRSVIDARTAFISGEGISLALQEGVSIEHKELFKKFIEINRLNGNGLFDLVRQTELQGYAVSYLLNGNDRSKMIPIMGLAGTDRGKKFLKPIYSMEGANLFVKGIEQKDSKALGEPGEKLNLSHFVYIRTGGDGSSAYSPTCKTGIVLKECENYDRASGDIRELNYRMARITADFKTSSDKETKALAEALQAGKWQIGDARIGTAEFDYKVPGTGAHSNLKDEMSTAVKTISGVTSVPVHWFGWVDLMSNRATADELYASIYNGTSVERSAIQDGLKELFIMMQEMAIASGLITEVTYDFTIKLPMIDFGRFKEMIDSYTALYGNEVISMATYRNIVPGIDPIAEKEQIKKEQEEREKDNPPVIPTDNSDLIEEPEEKPMEEE